MKGRIALVTGGMGGIGSHIARYLADHGATVAVTYFKNGNHDAAEQWLREQKQDGYDFKMYYVDLTDFTAAETMIAQVVADLGGLDILINNAGVTADITLAKMTPEHWHKVIDNNLHSIFNVTRNALGPMLEKKYGRIINISSINGQKGQFGQTNYCASKAGIHGFTKALAYEVAKKGVTVNTISPGYVRTPMLDKIDENILQDIIKQVPVGRLAEPSEIARAVGFLAAEDAAYITGSNFSINGGQHMY